MKERERMNMVFLNTGATNAECGQSGVTHLVVSDEVDSANIPQASSHVQVVKQQWFWESIQIDACADEHLYQARVSGGFTGGNCMSHTCHFVYAVRVCMLRRWVYTRFSYKRWRWRHGCEVCTTHTH